MIATFERSLWDNDRKAETIVKLKNVLPAKLDYHRLPANYKGEVARMVGGGIRDEDFVLPSPEK